MNMLKMKKMALVGLLGGILFAIGDILVCLLPNYHNQEGMYSDWIKMNGLRPAFCMYLGCIGAGLLLVGFHSWYVAMKENGTQKTKRIMQLIGFGIVLTSIGHFVIASLAPMAYKGVILAGADSKMAMDIVGYLAGYTYPIKCFVMLVVILVQSVFMIYAILKRKINCPKWMVILNPLVLTILSIPTSILLSGTGLEGMTESFESLGEGFLYLPVYFHWKNQSK